MTNPTTQATVLRLHRQGVTKREIVRRVRLDWKTVSRIICRGQVRTKVMRAGRPKRDPIEAEVAEIIERIYEIRRRKITESQRHWIDRVNEKIRKGISQCLFSDEHQTSQSGSAALP